MNKLFTKIATAFVGIAMAVGVGVAVGSNEAKSVSAASTATYTVDTVSSLTVSGNPTGSSHTFSTNGALNSGAIQLAGKTAQKNFTLTLTGYAGYKITALSVNAKSNKSSGNGALTLVAGSTTLADSDGYKSFNNAFWYGAWSQSEVTCDITLSNNNYTIKNNESVVLTITNNANSIYIYSVSFTYESGSSDPTKLATPTNVNYDSTNQRVTWGTVDHASSYKFSSDNGASYTSTGTNLYASVSSLTTGTTYNCKIVAVGDGSSYSDSDAASFQFTKTEPPSYTSVTVTGGAQQGTEKGSAYIQCSASATGTNIPASPSFTWYVTENNTYGTTTSVTNKASIDNTGKVTFDDNCTVYVWALAPDGTTHNTSGYAATASNLTDPKGSESNPYTCAEARSIATTTANNTHVTGIIYLVDSYNSTYHSLTYWISDDGTGDKTNKDGLQIYSGKGLNGADFSGTSDLTVGSTVVVQGDLKIYQTTTYELDKNSVIKSIQLPKTISSIAVKSAPDKTAYKSGESFDPTGLVITVTYSDTTTEDVPYAGHSGSFSFSPTTITAAGNVEITYQEKTCNQAVTLVTVTNVTGVASAPSEVYKDGSIDPDDVTLNVTYSDSTSGTVKATSVTCDTSAIAPGVTATATYSPATGTNTATFTVDVVKEPVYDTVVDELVLSDTGVSGNTYASWSGVVKTSGSVYAGFTNENSSNPGGGIGMRADTSKDATGIWVTSSAGVATKVEVVWTTTSSRTLYVFGKDTAYSSANYYSDMEGTEVGSITYSSTSVDLSAEYQYIGICVTGGAAGFSKIKITWKVEGADYPLTANPTLSTGAAASVSVGKNLALAVTTTPSNSDERLLVSSSNENYVTVSGTGKSFTIHGVAEGSATVTVKGAKGTYQSTTTITVTAASKTYEDKILDTTSLGITSYDTDITNSYTEDGVDYTCYNVMKNNGLQFKSSPAGYIANKEVLYTGTNTEIKSITLVMNKNNNGYITAYEGTNANPDQDVCSLVGTWDNTGVNTYTFSSGMTYFKLSATGTTNVDKIIIELVDEADSVLKEARLAALAILTDLSGLCGGDDAPGYVSQSDWNTLNADLTALNLSSDAKQFLKDATRISLDNLSQGGAEIENAMAHYDACVEKFGYTPFTGITNAQAHRIIPIALISSKNTNTIIIVIVTVGIAAIAIGGYFLLRKKKED